MWAVRDVGWIQNGYALGLLQSSRKLISRTGRGLGKSRTDTQKHFPSDAHTLSGTSENTTETSL